MTQLLTSSADHLLADLVEELSQKLAEGSSADVEAFLAIHADHAEKLRPLIPTLQVLVEMGSSPGRNGRSRTSQAEDHEHPTGGQPVLGDFRILREVGRGGMGVVYEAEQISLRRRVALKVLPTAAMLDPRALQRFRNEAQAAAALHHSQIVPIFGVGCERGVHYYAMQFIDGLTLAEVITALRESAGLEPLHQPDTPARESAATAEVGKRKAEAPSAPAPSLQPPAPSHPTATETDVLAALSTEKSRTSPAWFRRIAEQFAQVAEALHHAHELGVTHRDIKPANLMLDRLGHIWITDFGLARIEGEGNLTMTGDLVGTLRYMSPEQALAKRIGIDHRTDIYSLGITLYELLTLHPALPGHGRQELLRQLAVDDPRPPRKLVSSIPNDLETIILKAIEKIPADRYHTAAELADDLRRFTSEGPIQARRPTLAERCTRWTRRHKTVVGTAVLTAALAIIVGGALMWRERTVALGERDTANRHRERSEQNLRVTTGTLMSIHYILTSDQYRDRPELAEVRDKIAGETQSLYTGFIDDENPDPLILRDSAAAHLCLASFHFRRGELNQCAADFSRAASVWTRLADENATDWLYRSEAGKAFDQLGQVYYRAGNIDEADAAFRSAKEAFLRSIKLRPDHDSNHCILAFLLSARPNSRVFDPKEALRQAGIGLECAKRDTARPHALPIAETYLGVAQYRNGDWSQAAETLEATLGRENRRRAMALLFAAMSHHQAGNSSAAIERFHEGVKHIREHPHSELELGPFRAEAGALLGVTVEVENTRLDGPTGAATTNDHLGR